MAPRKRVQRRWEHLEVLTNGNGDITIGRIGSIRCAATAADGDSALAMLIRNRNESLEELLSRLNEAVRMAFEEDTYTDEING
jgi:hypothetical protein